MYKRQTQVKLLRVLQEREVRPVGATASQAIDVRIVAATHRDLAEMVAAGTFRQDLYYRLKVVSVEVPPLRARPEEILPLARHFCERTSAAYKLPPRLMSPEVAALLVRHAWPGNVRELEHALERAVVLAPGPILDAASLGLTPAALGLAPAPATAAGLLLPHDLALDDVERRYAAAALDRVGGNQSAAARALGISRNRLARLLRG